ncbi:MAG TPA: alcohol dehydrogenase catalytic domain-containing protein [Acidimicrobiales bacterium]|nr:alcohol dehydrogenase catalytic domain-containing protein [Acidimicrobiales bacterium]
MGPTMTAYRMVAWGEPPRLTEARVPEPGPGEVLVEVAGNGLCHSDATMAQIPAEVAAALGWHLPFTLGHEIGGRIAALGPGVRGFVEGEAVALVSPASCGRCAACRRGHDSACPHGQAGRGYGRDGGLARYVTAPAPRGVVRLHGLDPLVAGPLTDAGATSHHAVARVLPRLDAGATAVVLGAGGLGAFAVQLLRALSPARVVAVDTNPARRVVALSLGAHAAVDEVGAVAAPGPGDGGPRGGGVEVVLDFVGTDATIAAGLAAVRPYGAFGLVGAAGGTFRRPWFGGLPRDADVFTFQGSSIADVEAVVALAAAGRIRCEIDVFPLARVADAYAALARGELRGRAVVTPDP